MTVEELVREIVSLKQRLDRIEKRLDELPIEVPALSRVIAAPIAKH